MTTFSLFELPNQVIFPRVFGQRLETLLQALHWHAFLDEIIALSLPGEREPV